MTFVEQVVGRRPTLSGVVKRRPTRYGCTRQCSVGKSPGAEQPAFPDEEILREQQSHNGGRPSAWTPRVSDRDDRQKQRKRQRQRKREIKRAREREIQKERESEWEKEKEKETEEDQENEKEKGKEKEKDGRMCACVCACACSCACACACACACTRVCACAFACSWATALHLATLSSQILARFLRRMRTPVWLGAERTWLAGSLTEKADKALVQTPKAIIRYRYR